MQVCQPVQSVSLTYCSREEQKRKHEDKKSSAAAQKVTAPKFTTYPTHYFQHEKKRGMTAHQFVKLQNIMGPTPAFNT